ncbi:competence protein CoiA family protein [Haloactinomyces albus]|uniref:Competence protein CoiA nuclease-like domain-containing protein n=1 Tax=Haloactinomyces albus TaxID=1352928 RepID=A0AAE3ZF83_9ACTN|nr:competence protein CoiA family protein [Haloactinomyces albus]MDR7303861.1 hypothetical protein [Haloactinomyces albus]
MNTRVHATVELAAWQDGETRQVYARYKSEPTQLFFLEDGDVEPYRQWLKDHVECFMPECANRALIPRHGNHGRRDHFGHHSGAGGHGDESLAHEQGKHVLQRWLERQEAVLETQLERSLGRHAVIDVYASDGDFELAVEMQYSALTPSKWRHRHEVYGRHGIIDVWVWGHRGPQLQLDRTSTGKLRLTGAQREVAATGYPLVWLKPERGEVLTGWVYKHLDAYSQTYQRRQDWHDGYDNHKGFQVPPGAEDETCWVTLDALDDCDLDEWGLLTPTRRLLQQQHTEWQQVTDARRQQDCWWAERDQQAREAMATPELREHAWQRDPRRQWLLDEFGQVPAVLDGDNSTTAGVWAHPRQWRAILYVEHVHQVRPGYRFGVPECYRTLRAHHIVLDNPGPVITEFLETLEQAGLIRVVRQRGKILECWVRGPISATASPEPRAEEPTESTDEADSPSETPDENAEVTQPLPKTAPQREPAPVPTSPSSPATSQPAQPRRQPWWKRFFWRR